MRRGIVATAACDAAPPPRCEARLRLAVKSGKQLGLCPRFGLWPNVLGEARTRGAAPFLSLQRTARQSLASHRGGIAAAACGTRHSRTRMREGPAGSPQLLFARAVTRNRSFRLANSFIRLNTSSLEIVARGAHSALICFEVLDFFIAPFCKRHCGCQFTQTRFPMKLSLTKSVRLARDSTHNTTLGVTG